MIRLKIRSAEGYKEIIEEFYTIGLIKITYIIEMKWLIRSH